MLAALVPSGLALLAAGWTFRACSAVGDARAPDASDGTPNGSDRSPAQADTRAGFGFRGLEIYKVGDGTSSLCTADFDGDGLSDLALIDNRRSRVDVLRRLPAGAPDAPDPDRKSGPNALAYGGRFERRRFPVERRVLQLAAGDFNRDRRDDLVWVTDDGELTVVWSDAPAGSNAAGAAPREERRTIDALRSGCAGLQRGDFDGDGHDDLLLVAPDQLLGIPVREKGLGEPIVLDQFETVPTRVFLCEFGRGTRTSRVPAPGDLLYAYLNADAPLRYRLAMPGGGFGPRVDLEMPQIRSIEAAYSASGGPTELLAVFKLSGRLSLLSFSPLETGRRALLRHALREGGEKRDVPRTFDCGDLDGDGAADVLAAEPDTASIAVAWGTKGARGLALKSYPSLTGLSWPKLADVDGDGTQEVVCISASERMVGVARLRGGSQRGGAQGGTARDLQFPVTSPIDGEPAALDVADLDGDRRADAIVLVAQGEGRARKHRLDVRSGQPDGTLSEPKAYPIEGLKKTPYALRMIDLDRDGKLDALAFAPGEKAVPTLILSREGSFVADERAEDAPGLGILAGVGPSSIAAADVDGDGHAELLVAQANFVRALAFELDASSRAVPRVVLQLNAPAPDARLSAVAYTDWNGDGRADVIVRDETTRDLIALDRTDAGLRVLERASSARMEFTGMSPADLDGDGRSDLAVYARGEIGALYGGGRESGFDETASYEPGEERVILDQIASGDLGGNAEKEVVVTELTRHALAILEHRENALVHALGFEVYEKKSFEDDNPEREPREVRCADFDGDHRADLALLVHDKLIVYLQE